MIKFISDNLIGIGLTSENIRQLKQGDPIIVEGSTIGKSHDIFIFYGKNERDLIKTLKDEFIIDENTKIKGSWKKEKTH